LRQISHGDTAPQPCWNSIASPPQYGHFPSSAFAIKFLLFKAERVASVPLRFDLQRKENQIFKLSRPHDTYNLYTYVSVYRTYIAAAAGVYIFSSFPSLYFSFLYFTSLCFFRFFRLTWVFSVSKKRMGFEKPNGFFRFFSPMQEDHRPSAALAVSAVCRLSFRSPGSPRIGVRMPRYFQAHCPGKRARDSRSDRFCCNPARRPSFEKQA
jgi:hypothetical protein